MKNKHNRSSKRAHIGAPALRLQDMSKSSRLKTLLASFGLALLLQFLAGMFHLHNTLINPLISLVSVVLFFMGILQIIYMVRADTAVKKVPEASQKRPSEKAGQSAAGSSGIYKASRSAQTAFDRDGFPSEFHIRFSPGLF